MPTATGKPHLPPPPSPSASGVSPTGSVASSTTGADSRAPDSSSASVPSGGGPSGVRTATSTTGAATPLSTSTSWSTSASWPTSTSWSTSTTGSAGCGACFLERVVAAGGGLRGAGASSTAVRAESMSPPRAWPTSSRMARALAGPYPGLCLSVASWRGEGRRAPSALVSARVGSGAWRGEGCSGAALSSANSVLRHCVISTTAAETPKLAAARGDDAGRRARPSAAAAAAAASLPRFRTVGGEASTFPSADAVQKESTSRSLSLSAVQGRGPPGGIPCPKGSAAVRSESAAAPPAPRGDES